MGAAVALARPAVAVSPATRKKIADAARGELCRRSLYHFVVESWDVLEPGTAPDWNWHIQALCWHIQMLLEGWLVANGHAPANGNARQREIRRRVELSWQLHGLTLKEREILVQNAIFNLPPGTLKSRILMVCAPAWMWLHCPSWTVCAISGVDDNVTRDSNMHRELVESEWYRESFKITWTLSKKKNSVKSWETSAGGKRKSRTIQSSFTGVRVDALFLDDPDDAHKVFSEPKRKEVHHKWRRAIRNRMNHLNRSLRIAIQQRVHVDDWTSAQVAKGTWTPQRRKAWMWVVWPLRFGRGPKDVPALSPFGFVDPRRVANENLHTERFPDEVIADEIVDRGPDGFAAQYDQNPEDIDGGMIKRSYVRFFRIEDQPISTRARPYGCGLKPDGTPEDAFVLKRDERTGKLDLDFLAVTIDCSNGSESEDASATSIIVFGGKGQQRFIFEDRTRVMGPLEMQDEVVRVVQDWEPNEVLIEAKAAGPSRIAELRMALQKGLVGRRTGKAIVCTVVPIDPGGESKEQRAAAMIPVWAAGFVYVLDGAAWLYTEVTATGKTVDLGLVGEVCGFPKVKKNDRVDAISQAITHYREAISNVRRWELMSR